MSNKFDYHIKNNVDRHEYDVDPQEIWDGILAKQQPKSKKKIWFLLLPFVIGSIVTILWLINDKDTLTASETSSIHQLEEKHSALSEISNSNSSNQSRNISSSSNQSSIELALTSEEKPTGHLENRLTLENSTNTKVIVQKQTQVSNSFSSPAFYNRFAPTQLSDTNLFSSENNSLNETVASNDLTKFEKAIEYISIAQLALLNNSVSYNRQTPTLESTPAFAAATPINVTKTSKARWSASILGGYGLFNKSIISASNANEALLRNETERPIDLFSTNVLINYSLNKSWSISSGITYQKAYEKLQWSGSYFQDSNGSVIPDLENLPENFNTVAYEKVERNIAASFNSYEYIDIPLQVSYKPQLSMKLRTALTAGVSANVININQGFVVNSQDIPIDLSSISDEYKIGLRYSLGLSMMWPVSERLGLQVNGIYSLRNNKQRDLTLRYDSQELNLGINYMIK